MRHFSFVALSLLAFGTLAGATGAAAQCPGVAGRYRIVANGHLFDAFLEETGGVYLRGAMAVASPTTVGQVLGGDVLLGDCRSSSGVAFTFRRFITAADGNGEVPGQRYEALQMVGGFVTGTFTHSTASLGTSTYGWSAQRVGDL